MELLLLRIDITALWTNPQMLSPQEMSLSADADYSG